VIKAAAHLFLRNCVDVLSIQQQPIHVEDALRRGKGCVGGSRRFRSDAGAVPGRLLQQQRLFFGAGSACGCRAQTAAYVSDLRIDHRGSC